jgi:hypothetical protein
MDPLLSPARLVKALDQAIRGDRAPLYDLLARGSRLPGTRANDALADLFAQTCRAAGATADPVALAAARLTPDEAPGATALEFLPVCGVLALAARAAADDSIRTPFLTELHARADDTRFRVRDAVVEGLVRIGAKSGDALAIGVSPWMDGYFHAAAVLRALADERWLGALDAAGPALDRLDDAFLLARDAPRAAARYPGRKELVEALRKTPRALALRFGAQAFDRILSWPSTEDPALLTVLPELLRDKRLAARFAPDLDRIRRALEAAKKPARNPDHDVGPTRDRSRSRRTGRRR